MNRIKNMRDIIDSMLIKDPDFVAFLVREGDGVRKITNLEFVNDVRSLAVSIALSDTKCCALIGENSYKWIVSFFAITYAGAILVPIDGDLGSKEISNIVTMAECDMIIWGSSHDDVVEPIIKSGLRNLFFQSDNSTRKKEGSIELEIEKGVAAIEKNNEIFDNIVVDPNSVFEYVFTSGTTGTSKGVMLSHNNIISNLYASKDLEAVGRVSMAILPMYHTYQSTLGNIFSMFNRTTIAINNSIKNLSQNFKLFKPTDLPCVPLVMETIHQNIWKNIREQKKERSVRFMMKFCRFMLGFGVDMRKSVFKKIHDNFGGEFKSFFVGGALLDFKVAQDMSDFGFNINIGYGISECAPMISANCTQKYSKLGSCGFPVGGYELKLMNITPEGDGEVWTKGSNVMLGYLNNEKATSEVLNNGWFNTGDIGRYDKDGYLYITGRKKNMIVLNNGKNIYPEEIEGIILQHEEIQEVVVFADKSELGKESAIVAEIYPNLDHFEKLAIDNPKQTIEKIISDVNEKLPYYKRITNVIIREEEFEKTTTKKIKRHKL